MPNSPSLYHNDDVFRLLTSLEWMNRRRLSPSNFHPYIEDLQHLALAYETGALDDLPKRIALSYLEHRVRSVYAEVPKSILEALWLSYEDVNSRILPLALSMPTLRQRIEYLHRLAELLILDDKFADALAVMDVALALYSTTDEADYCDEHVRRGMGHALAKAYADLRRVDYDLLDSLYRQHQWLDASINDSRQWDADSVGSRFTRDVLQGVLERLGKTGAFEQATDLIRHSGEKWLSGYKWYSAQRLTQHLTVGLIIGKHFADAEQNLLDLGFDQQDVVRLWCDYLDELYDANEEARFSAVRPKIEHTPVWPAITERSQRRRPGLTTGQFPQAFSDGRPDQSEIRNWLAAQFTANLWQHEFSRACDYLDFWPTLENRALTDWPLLFKQIKIWRRRQSLSSRSGAYDISFGSFSTSDSACLWLARLGRFDVLEKLASTGVYKDWPTYQLFHAAPTLLSLSKVHTIVELREWLPTAQLESVSGCAYLAFQLAKQSKQVEAERVLKVVPNERPWSHETVRLSLAQGLALGAGIEEARRYIKERCQIMEHDYAGDIWTVAQALIAVDRVDDAIKLLLEDTYEHPGMPQTWVDLAGVLRRQYGAEKVAEKLAPISLKFATDIASKYAIVDEEYARGFLSALMKRIPDPNWGKGLGTDWPGVVEQVDEIDSLHERVGDRLDRTALGRLIIGRDALAGLLREVLWGFGMSADSLLKVMVMVVPGKVWTGGSDQSANWPRLEQKQVQAELQALEELQLLVHTDDFSLESLFYSRLGCCCLSAYPYHDLMVPLVENLATMLYEHPQRLWYGIFAVPAALAKLGRTHEAIKLARHVSQQLPSAFDELHEIENEIGERIFEYCRGQIALAAPASSERDTLLADILLKCKDIDRLMQMFVCFVQQGDDAADKVLEVLTRASSEIRWPIENASESSSGPVDQTSTVLSNVRSTSADFSRLHDSAGLDREVISSSPPSTTDSTEDWFSDDVAELADAEEVDGSKTKIDWDLANQLCYHLLVAGRTEMLELLLQALNAPEQVIHETIALSPTSLEGMLDTFSIGGSRSDFRPDSWPHSVLLAEADRVDSADSFFELIAAAEQVVNTKDVTKAYQAVTGRLSPKALSIVIRELADEARDLDGFRRAVLTACLVPEATRMNDSEMRATELVSRSLQYLDSYIAEKENFCWVRLWGKDRVSFWGRGDGVEMSPKLAYCRGLAVLVRCVGQAGLTDEYNRIQSQFMDTMYGLLRKTESWGERGYHSFEDRLLGVLEELDEEEVTEQVVKVFRDIGRRWKANQLAAARKRMTT